MPDWLQNIMDSEARRNATRARAAVDRLAILEASLSDAIAERAAIVSRTKALEARAAALGAAADTIEAALERACADELLGDGPAVKGFAETIAKIAKLRAARAGLRFALEDLEREAQRANDAVSAADKPLDHARNVAASYEGLDGSAVSRETRQAAAAPTIASEARQTSVG